MRENTLDVLFYLFDNYSEVDDVSQNRDMLQGYLKEAGFQNKNISKAFDWLESLAKDDNIYLTTPEKHAIRHYSKYEKRWLDEACQGYLMTLEQSGVLTAEMRERVIDRVLELGDRDFDLSRLKWVILMLLLNQPNSEAEYIWMDNVAMGDEPLIYH